MKLVNGQWYSDFPPHGQGAVVLQGNTAVIAVTSSDRDILGGHAVIVAEWTQGQDVCFQRFDLIIPSGVLTIRSTDIEMNKDTNLQVPFNLYYRSWVVDPIKVVALRNAVNRFRTKVNGGRYEFNHQGGLIGRLTSGPGKRGVNCADFCVKVLTEAGVGHLVSGLFTTPVSLTGRRWQVV